MTSTDKKRYNKMENVLQYINKNFVTVSDEDIKKTSPLLNHVIDTIIANMKIVSPLFDSLFENLLYGGSYFDGLKVGKPEEFDIDLRLVLPKLVKATLKQTNVPGFVSLKMPDWETFEKSSDFLKKKDLAKFKDSDNYLVQDEVLRWMMSTVSQALNLIGKINNKAEILYEGKIAYVSLKNSGPAVTAKVTYGDINMDVDLVVSFKLTAEQWPQSPFRPLPKECNGKREFLIVPKAPKVDIGKKERYWRLSFQEQEKVLISGSNTCKPALRLLKKLRDNQNHNISSYYIKTVFLHEIEKQSKDKSFWNASLSFNFMHMLKTYRDYLDSNKIPYYWNKNNNLLQNIDKITVDNICKYLTRVINTIDSKIDENPFIVADYLSTPDERVQMCKVNITVGKKSTNVDQMSIVENSLAGTTGTLQVLMTNLYQANTDEIRIANAGDAKNSKSDETIISLLKSIQSSINILQTDVNYAVQKANSIENTLGEVKNDFNNLSGEVKNISSLLQNIGGFNCQKDKKDLIEHTNVKVMLQRIDDLETTIQTLRSDYSLLKSSFKKFALSD